MKSYRIFALVLLVPFWGCKSDTNVLSRSYHVNGNLKLEVTGNDLRNACYSLYWENGKKRTEFCMLDSLYDGVMVFYDSAGRKENSRNYRHGIQDGGDTIFWVNGNIREIYQYREDKKNGQTLLYDTSGKLEAINLVKNDSIFLIELYNADGRDTITQYIPLLWTTKDTFKLGDTLTVTIELPTDSFKRQFDSLVVLYDVFFDPPEGETLKGFDNAQRLDGQVITPKFEVTEPGRYHIACILRGYSQGSFRMLSARSKDVYFVE